MSDWAGLRGAHLHLDLTPERDRSLLAEPTLRLPLRLPVRLPLTLLLLLFLHHLPIAGELAAQEWTTSSFARPLTATDPVRVELRMHSGELEVRGTDAPELYRFWVNYDASRTTAVHRVADDGTIHLGLERGELRSRLAGGDRLENALGLALSTAVPLDLALQFGAVQAALDLTGLALRGLTLEVGAADVALLLRAPNPEALDRVSLSSGAAAFRGVGLGYLRAAVLEVRSGVGDLELDLGGLDRDDTDLRLSLAVGSVEITVPAGVGIRLRKRTLLTVVEAPELVRDSGNEYFSSNWEGAEVRLTIDLSSAIGSVRIRRPPP